MREDLERITAERDRQYDMNVSLIAQIASREADIERLMVVLAKADMIVAAFEVFNDAEHNRSDCAECSGDGHWVECEPCCDTVGELLNGHLLAIRDFKEARATVARLSEEDAPWPI